MYQESGGLGSSLLFSGHVIKSPSSSEAQYFPICKMGGKSCPSQVWRGSSDPRSKKMSWKVTVSLKFRIKLVDIMRRQGFKIKLSTSSIRDALSALDCSCGRDQELHETVNCSFGR